MKISFDVLNDIQKRAANIIVSNIEPDKLNDISFETNLDINGMNSITFIKTVVDLEGEFDFEFDDEMLLITAFPTIMSMIKYVETKI